MSESDRADEGPKHDSLLAGWFPDIPAKCKEWLRDGPALSFVCLLVGCLRPQQHASVSQERICSDNFMCCHPEIEVADQAFHLTQSQYTDTGPIIPRADLITPGAWEGSHWIATGMPLKSLV